MEVTENVILVEEEGSRHSILNQGVKGNRTQDSCIQSQKGQRKARPPGPRGCIGCSPRAAGARGGVFLFWVSVFGLRPINLIINVEQIKAYYGYLF